MRRTFVVLLCLAVLTGLALFAETSPNANTDATYQALRNVKLSGEAVGAENLVLKRDAGTFTFTNGTFCFLAPVEGKVTGAVFTGNGTFELKPPIAVERTSLSRLSRQMNMVESFDQLVLRFTDDTYQQLKKDGSTGAGRSATCSSGQLDDINNALRKDRMLRQNLHARILADVYSKEAGGLFVAFIKGKKYNGKMIYTIDPHGAYDNEEVSLQTWDENKYGIWTAFHLASEYASGKASSSERNSLIKIDKQQLDTTLEKSGKLTGKATTTFVARTNGVRVVPFSLFPTLRVSKVIANGQDLKFIQEDKDEDADFWVILPQPLAKDQQFTITTEYAGKDAVQSQGSGNYYLAEGARDSWYPAGRAFAGYASYDMRFTYPKEFKLVATGDPVKETTEGSVNISEWRSQEPLTVAAFNFGTFKKDQKVVKGITLEAYANKDLPDVIRNIQIQVSQYDDDVSAHPTTMGGANSGMTLGSISTTDMAKKAMAEAEFATQLYTDYFGATPFKRLAMTQQTAVDYGQSWPGLVWLPMSYFLDGTIRHQLFGFDVRGYFKVVGPHEIAHQWWGHTISWASYRDQWMSEGFSETSASIFMQKTMKLQEFLKFWNDERDLLVERNKEGFRAIDAAPVTLGYRSMNAKTGYDIPRKLIYPKGGYILHMIRMMMMDSKTGDERFKTMMKDFVTTYHNKPASTEDFKAMVEKHMTPAMNLSGNGKMDWFFDEYVYGTALPKYTLDYKIGGDSLSLSVTQANVDENFRMIVPLYVEWQNGNIGRMGTVSLVGNTSQEVKVPLKADKPKRIMLNYLNDVLCDK